MDSFFSLLNFWGYLAAGFTYAALAIWIYHRYGSTNRQQVILLVALAVTAIWGVMSVIGKPFGIPALVVESIRNFIWLGFMFFLLRSGQGRKQPRTINMIYLVLSLVLLVQPVSDIIMVQTVGGVHSGQMMLDAAFLLRMIFAVGALVMVHNLYSVSAPEARWGVSLPMAALAAMWTYDLNLYIISYLMGSLTDELMAARGAFMTLLAPVFIMASRRNSSWRLRLSRSVAFQSVSFIAISLYLMAMILLTTAIGYLGGANARLAQIILVFSMSIGALLIMPSGRFRAWLNVVIAKNFFQHRYDYRAEWMRFADTIGFPSTEAVPFHERVIKSLADIFDSPGGLLLVPGETGMLRLEAQWNWPVPDIPARCVTEQTLPFFESSGYILSMDEVRSGVDTRFDPRAVPQWLCDEMRAWAVVPLIHFGKLAGLAILARPPIRQDLDWEDLDMLRVVGRQLASYLAEETSQNALAESREFAEFNQRFAFVMHDIKNLVSQLSLLARNSEKYGNNPEFQSDMVETLRGSVDKMNTLLARLSHHDQSNNGGLRQMDVGKTVMRAVHNKRLSHPVQANLPSGILAVGHPERVETIIGHLVQNAIEASNEKSAIKIGCEICDCDVAITIADDGIGMSEAFMAKRLFKPFESTKEGGFGVGAYEARALAIGMGGQLRVESAVGAGTKFTLLLPHAKRPGGKPGLEKAA